MKAIIESKEFWQQHVEKLKVSGMNRRQYCQGNQVNYDRFGYWIKRLSCSDIFVPVKLKITESPPSCLPLCTLELRGHVLKIHDLSALTFILDRMS